VRVCVCGFVWDRGGAMKEDRKKIMKGLFSVERKNKSVRLIIFEQKKKIVICVCVISVLLWVCV